MDTLIGDSQKASSKILAGQGRAFKKKEGRFQLGKSIFNTLAQFVPGGKAIKAGMDIIGDPILRSLGFGGDASKFNLSGKNIAFGGVDAAKDMRTGARDYLDMARERSITSGITSLASFGLDKGWDKKLGDMFGGNKLSQQEIGTSLAKEAISTPLVGDAVTATAGGEGYNILDIIKDTQKESSQEGWLDKLSMPAMPSIMKYLKQDEYDQDYWDGQFGAFPSSKMNPRYEQGGMVQEYQEGGQIKRMMPAKYTGAGSQKREISAAYPVWDTYTYDGINWNKAAIGLETNPNLPNMTKDQMNKYRDEGRTADVSSQYMDDSSEHGIQEFLRTPAVFGLVEKARAGDAYALENIIEMLRQSRPDLDKTNNELRESLKKILPDMDLYGEGYQAVLAEGATTLDSLTETATGLRAEEATQKATSGIRTPGTENTISEGLYKGAESVYSGMQKGIKGEFDKSFDDFGTMISNPNLS